MTAQKIIAGLRTIPPEASFVNDHEAIMTPSAMDNVGERDLSVEMNAPVQPTAAARFFETPEMCERMLLYLEPMDVLHAQQASVIINNTIRGSVKLQRALFYSPDQEITADHRTLRRFTYVFRPNNGERVDVVDESKRLPRANPFIFEKPDVLQFQPETFCLQPRIERVIDSSSPDLQSLAEMLLTQPPVTRIQVECRFFHASPLGLKLAREWPLYVADGIKVKDLVACAREVFAKHYEDTPWTKDVWHSVHVKVGDPDEAEDHSWQVVAGW
ncbi:unnamed protein product [Zymoseptoria tritici ST99CH_1E4]|uniref:Uncharacterized protein n=1 Tax=Zymoseptoria tritici ST99CH_1E4 TaxID=1276532 RepID=A0A2H1GQ12_ZYMTR|nr:unnamed protein product [Zymoseptoria tritici ST99CH_1E4]